MLIISNEVYDKTDCFFCSVLTKFIEFTVIEDIMNDDEDNDDLFSSDLDDEFDTDFGDDF